ncbi:MAG: 30S ribosomal protein S12 methylthiotransferase RimO [candidate division WOR-3 bacterium]
MPCLRPHTASSFGSAKKLLLASRPGSPLACVISLGCPKNLVDSEHILGYLGQAGFAITTRPQDANLIVINTCAFLASAVQEARQAIMRYLRLKHRRAGTKIVVAGCLVQRYGSRLACDFPDVDIFLGIDEIPKLPQLVSGADSRSQTQDTTFGDKPLPCSLYGAKTPRLVSTPRHYAYLRIAEGCNNRCSYCLIPSLRGALRCRTVSDILAEARLLLGNQARELILIAQDTTAYHSDGHSLPELLRRLSQLVDLRWLRLLYTHPGHFSPRLIDEIAMNPKIVKYVDVPLQHVNNRVLARMNRPYRRTGIDRLVRQLEAIPGMVLRTTFLVGFPGETEAEFSELLAFVAEGHFTHVGCFAFSREPGTKAYRMRAQVPWSLATERAQRLLAIQRRVALRLNQRLVGRVVEAVIDRPGPGQQLVGRTIGDAPEIDRTLHITSSDQTDSDLLRDISRHAQVGSFVKVRITKVRAYDLYGVIAER